MRERARDSVWCARCTFVCLVRLRRVDRRKLLSIFFGFWHTYKIDLSVTLVLNEATEARIKKNSNSNSNNNEKQMCYSLLECKMCSILHTYNPVRCFCLQLEKCTLHQSAACRNVLDCSVCDVLLLFFYICVF